MSTAMPPEDSPAAEAGGSPEALEPEVSDWLIEVAQANPGRLARLLDWIASQPPRSVALDELPAPLVGTDDEAWADLESLSLDAAITGPAAVAQGGCTVADVVRAAGYSGDPDDLAEDLQQAPGLFRVGSQPDPEVRGVAVVDASVLDSFAARYGPAEVAAAHGRHARPWSNGPLAPASAYQLANAVLHATSSQQPPAPFELASQVAFLARLLRSIGPVATEAAIRAALLPDHLAEALIGVIRQVGPLAAAEPELAAGLLTGAWIQLGRDATELGDPRWPSVLELERIVAIDPGRPRWELAAARPVAILAEGRIVLAEPGVVREIEPGTGIELARQLGPEQPTLLAVGPSLIVVADGRAATVVGTDFSAELPARQPVTALAVTGQTIVTGHQDGTIALHRADRLVAADAPGQLPVLQVIQALLANGQYALAEGIAKSIQDPSQQAQAIRTLEQWRSAGPEQVQVRAELEVFEGFLRSLDRATVPPALIKDLEAQVAQLRDRIELEGGHPEVTTTGASNQPGPVTVLAGHGSPITAIHADAEKVLAAAADGILRVWTLPGLEESKYVRHRAAVRHAASWSGYLITADDQGWVRIWDPASGADLVHLGGHSAGVTGLLVFGSGAVTTSSDGSLRWWDLDGGTGHRTLRQGGPAIVAAAAVNAAPAPEVEPSPQLDVQSSVGQTSLAGGWPAATLVTAGADGTLEWWDLQAGTATTQRPAGVVGPVTDLIGGGSAVLVHAAGLSALAPPPGSEGVPERPTVAVDRSGSAVRATWGATTVEVDLDTATAAVLGPGTAAGAQPAPGTPPSRLPASLRSVVQVTAVAGGDGASGPGDPGLLAVGGADGSVWVVQETGAVRQIGRHEDGVQALALIRPAVAPVGQVKSSMRVPSPRHRQVVVSSGADGTLRAWDVQRGTCLGALRCDAPLVALDAADGTLVGATMAGILWVVRTNPPRALGLDRLDAQPVHLTGAAITVQPQPAALRAREREYLVDASFTLVAPIEVDLVAVGLKLLPAARFEIRAHRVTAAPIRGPQLPAGPAVPLHEPLPLPLGTATVTISARAFARGDAAPGGLELGVDLWAPELGGPVELVLSALGPVSAQLLDGAQLVPRYT